MLEGRLELPRVAPHGPKPCAYTNSAIPALYALHLYKIPPHPEARGYGGIVRRKTLFVFMLQTDDVVDDCFMVEAVGTGYSECKIACDKGNRYDIT